MGHLVDDFLVPQSITPAVIEEAARRCVELSSRPPCGSSPSRPHTYNPKSVDRAYCSSCGESFELPQNRNL